MSYKILLVEDDSGIAQAIEACLRVWDMQVATIQDFRNVMEEFTSFAPHLVLMDITLPFMSGYHWCQEIRKCSSVPILFISSASDTMNIILAVNLGADDFIVKPFDQSLLIAKLQALLRRAYAFAAPFPTLECKGAKLDTNENVLIYQDEKIPLTKNEFRILLTLMQNKGKIVSREKLMEALWETDSFIDENTLTVNVGRLRKKLETKGLHPFIQTKFGEGYWIGER